MTSGVVVRPVQTGADLRRFIGFPYKLHRGDPLWVPQLRMDVRKMLSRDKNPFFAHGEADYFLARRGGKVVGRIAAIHNENHNEFHEDRVGFFGFFECVNDPVVASALFEEAANWLRARGLDTMRGPTSFSTNDECGLMVDGLDKPPVLLNPHNPRYYIDLVEQAGFSKAKDLYLYQSTSPKLPERLMRGAELLARRKDLQLRHLDKKRFDEEVGRIKQVYNAAWEKNWGFVPMSDAEVDHLAAQLKPVVVPELVVFVEQGSRPVGFAAALPDLNVALKKNPSGRLFPGILKVLWAARKISRARILLLGLVKEFRMSGADALMMRWIWEHGTAMGFNWAESGWILEDNAPMNNAMIRIGFEHYKTLRLYDRQL